MRATHSAVLFALGSVLLTAACATTTSRPSIVAAQAPVAQAPAPAMPPPEQRPHLAVLPIDDDELFRAERAALRLELAGHLARLAPDHVIVPLAEVDAKLRPVSNETGHRCALEDVPASRHAHDAGWSTTDVVHLAGLAEGPGEALWIRLFDRDHSTATFEAAWNPKLPRIDRYRAAFAALVRTEDVGFVGGLMGTGSEEAALREGPVTVCERRSFRCDGGSVDWKDHAAELAACFSGEDDVTEELLVQGDAGVRWCEIENLDRTDGRKGAREACLCRALTASAAMGKRPGRRTVRVRYEAPDLAGKPRPELRVVEAANLHADHNWHSVPVVEGGKTRYTSVQRLEIDGLDALAAPLARCAVPSGSVIVADVDIREDGVPAGGRIIAGSLAREVAACIEHALGRGAFLCTFDGKPARVRIAMEWPGR